MTTKIIYSLKMMRYLVQNGLEVLEIKPHPTIKNFKCYVFEDTEKLRQLMKKFTEGE